MALEEFNPTASASGDAFNPDSEGAGGASSIERAAQSRMAQAKDRQANGIGTGAGIIGSLISTFATGNPMMGYAIGKNVGGDVAHRKAPSLPGSDQLQAVLGSGGPDLSSHAAESGIADAW